MKVIRYDHSNTYILVLIVPLQLGYALNVQKRGLFVFKFYWITRLLSFFLVRKEIYVWQKFGGCCRCYCRSAGKKSTLLLWLCYCGIVEVWFLHCWMGNRTGQKIYSSYKYFFKPMTDLFQTIETEHFRFEYPIKHFFVYHITFVTSFEDYFGGILSC